MHHTEFICNFCDKECKSKKALIAHECVCPKNPNRKTFNRKWSEEKKAAWAKKCQETKCNYVPWTLERRQRASIISKEANLAYWTEEARYTQSVRMKQVVLENSDSYSKNNVSGRVKMFEVQSTTGLTKVKGKWELAVANWLNKHNIEWTNDITPYKYFWNEGWHLYFPDFLITKYNLLLEVKGFETERDRCKWQAVSTPLKVIRKADITNLDEFMKQAGVW